MTAEATDTCARCRHFKMRDYPEHARVGIGRCTGYDNTQQALINPFMPWQTRACGRFLKAKDVAQRDDWIAKQGKTNEKEPVRK